MNAAIHRFAIVAGESSGDTLGADLIRYLKLHFPHAIFEGIGGEKMIAEGFNSFFPLERLAVMGFFEPLKRLPEILSIRRHIIKHFTQNKPTAFIGIDAPDFNLSVEQVLKKQGIKTVHYVSPTVWAWRQGRIKKIKKAVDLMLSLFPFESAIYHQHQIPIQCVGHPLADTIPLVSDKIAARQQLQLPMHGKILALLPGSRMQELKFIAPSFIETAQWIHHRDKTIQFVCAFPDENRIAQFKQIQASLHSQVPIQIYKAKSIALMAASDAILVASGTASLEAMLVKRPTVVAYKMSKLTFAIAKRVIKVPYIALPNLLADKCIMQEYIQDNATPALMGEQLLRFLRQPQLFAAIEPIFMDLHIQLKKNAGQTAAQEIARLIA